MHDEWRSRRWARPSSPTWVGWSVLASVREASTGVLAGQGGDGGAAHSFQEGGMQGEGGGGVGGVRGAGAATRLGPVVASWMLPALIERVCCVPRVLPAQAAGMLFIAVRRAAAWLWCLGRAWGLHAARPEQTAPTPCVCARVCVLLLRHRPPPRLLAHLTMHLPPCTYQHSCPPTAHSCAGRRKLELQQRCVSLLPGGLRGGGCPRSAKAADTGLWV